MGTGLLHRWQPFRKILGYSHQIALIDSHFSFAIFSHSHTPFNAKQDLHRNRISVKISSACCILDWLKINVCNRYFFQFDVIELLEFHCRWLWDGSYFYLLTFWRVLVNWALRMSIRQLEVWLMSGTLISVLTRNICLYIFTACIEFLSSILPTQVENMAKVNFKKINQY